MKQKIIIVFFVILVFFSPIPIGRTEAAAFASEEEIISFLKAEQPEETKLTCTPELYKRLSENGFYGLYRLMAKAGTDYTGAAVYYYEADHTIEIKSLSYTGIPAVEVRSAEDVQNAFRRFLSEGRGLILLCTDELLTELVDEHLADYYAAGIGIEDIHASYRSGIGIMEISQCEPFSAPWAYVEDYAQFAAAIDKFAEQDITDFFIVLERELFDKVRDETEMLIMTASSKLTGYGAVIYSDKRTCSFYGAEFTDAPREICRSTDDVQETIRRMGAVGISEFELIFPYPDVFEALAADDFALFHEIQAKAGMISCSMSYSYSNDRIIISEAEIVSDVTAMSTLQEAAAYTERLAAEGSRDIHLFCTADLFSALTDGLSNKFMTAAGVGMPRIYDLISHTGISDYEISTSEATRLINIHVNRFFAGTEIMLAVRSGDSSGLTEREMSALQAAREIAREAMTETDPVRKALFIHDWICAHVVYTTDDETDEDDNAVGAILNGEANCDGYSDAFYLIGSLAGLNIRYQHGDSLDKSAADQFYSGTHIWNLLEIDGSWRMVDVTWDDEERGKTHVWFNVGSDIAGRIHVWNRDMTLPIFPVTVRSVDFENEFYVRGETDPEQLIRTARERNLSDFYILFEDPAPAFSHEDVLDALKKQVSNNIIHYSWNEKAGLLGFFEIAW